MIIQRYLFREILHSLLGVTLILLLIFLSSTLVRILSDTIEGRYPADIMFAMLGYKSVANLNIVLSLSFFLSVLLALGRLYRDSEMVALLACGIQPSLVLRVTAYASLGVALVTGLLTLWLAPLAEASGDRLVQEAAARSDIEGIEPGRFNTAQSGGLVYVEATSPDKERLVNIFGRAMHNGRLEIVSAASAYQMHDSELGTRYLVLENGYRYEGTPGQEEFRIVRFEEHGLRLTEPEVAAPALGADALPTPYLYRSAWPPEQAELQWRLAMPVAAFLLGLLAVPLARSNPRQGRYSKLFAGIMLYIIYYNLLTLGRSWISREQVHPWLGLWWVHLVVLAVIVVLVVKSRRLTSRPLLGLLRR